MLGFDIFLGKFWVSFWVKQSFGEVYLIEKTAESSGL